MVYNFLICFNFRDEIGQIHIPKGIEDEKYEKIEKFREDKTSYNVKYYSVILVKDRRQMLEKLGEKQLMR